MNKLINKEIRMNINLTSLKIIKSKIISSKHNRFEDSFEISCLN